MGPRIQRDLLQHLTQPGKKYPELLLYMARNFLATVVSQPHSHANTHHDVEPAGQKLYWVIGDASGPVKLKVHDTKYTDNAGAFEVDIIVIPGTKVPEAKRVEPE